jgi:hypothetical protein
LPAALIASKKQTVFLGEGPDRAKGVVTPAGFERIWTPEFQGVVETR